ncbi:MAG: hypothetical protein WCK88_06305 [bacterium]
MAMFSTGSLSSSVLNPGSVNNTNLCADSFMKEYVGTYESDKAKIIELQQFVGRNCRGEVVTSKKSYCEARAKQIETYSSLVKRYEQCRDSVPTTEKK